MKRFLTVFLIVSTIFSAYSQTWKLKRYEVTYGISIFEYFGDVGGTADKSNLFGLKDINILSCRPGFNFGGTYKLAEGLYIHATNTFGIIAQKDEGSRNSNRGFAFRSIVDELSVQGIFFIIPEKRNYYYSIMKMRGGLRTINQPLSLYAFAGVGGLYYKVKAKENLVGSPRFVGDKSLTLTFPVGLGVKFAYSPDLSFNMELGARITRSDYLDGVTSAFSKHNDMYYILNFRAMYRISKIKDIKKLFR